MRPAAPVIVGPDTWESDSLTSGVTEWLDTDSEGVTGELDGGLGVDETGSVADGEGDHDMQERHHPAPAQPEEGTSRAATRNPTPNPLIAGASRSAGEQPDPVGRRTRS